MPTPNITASTAYYPRGTSECYYLPSVAAANLVPTRAEMNVGTRLTPQLMDWSGWTVEGNEVDNKDLSSEFDKTAPGSTSAESSSLTMRADVAGVDVRALLPRGTAGYIQWLPGGDVAGRKSSVWPIRVMSNSEQIETDAVGQRLVKFSITDEPNEDATIPA